MNLFMVPEFLNFVNRPNSTKWFRLNQWFNRLDFQCPHLFWAKFYDELNQNSIRPTISSGKWPFDFPFQHEKSKKFQLRFNNTPTCIHHSNRLWEPNNMRFSKNINLEMSNFWELNFFSPFLNHVSDWETSW